MRVFSTRADGGRHRRASITPLGDMRRWAYAAALILFLAFAYDLTRIPVQVSDSLGDIQEARMASSAAGAFMSVLNGRAYLRPLKAAQIRIVSDLSGGNLTLGYRSVHVLLLALAIWLFTRALRVQTAADLAAALFALTVLLGLHTFSNLLREAYPINHFLEIVVFALAALNLAQARPHWIVDVAAMVIFAAAALVVESGLLIWVVVVAARLSGLRGISRRGVVAVTLLLCAYAGLRTLVFSTGLPAVDERSSGYFLEVLDESQLIERFGENPLPFYVYNVAASLGSVLLSEPRGGQMVAARQYADGALMPWTAVAVISSLLTTILIVIAAVWSWRQAAHRHDADRFFFIFAAVLAANAVLSYAYTKDDIVSVAGAFYALAAYAAVRRLIAGAASARTLTVAVACATLAVASTGWAVRTAGLHYNLRYMAFKTRNDWASAPPRWMQTPETRAVTERLRGDALEHRVVAPRFYPPWQARWFEE
jgi:lipid-A-disaccharide synthase-like uncharacterized protein